MKRALMVFAALVVNAILFLCMRKMVEFSAVEARPQAKAQAVQLLSYEKMPPPPPPPEPEMPKPPTANEAVDMPSLPAMQIPAMTPSPSPRPSVTAPASAFSNSAHMSVKGKMWTGPPPKVAGSSKGTGTPNGKGAPTKLTAIRRAAPKPTLRVPPRYPPRALSEEIEGHVVVEFQIETDGSTSKVRAVQADPPDVFERAAEKAVRRWRFSPQPRPVSSRITLEFKLNEAL